jgi:MFS superfamily sulfate permease-like transporter
MMTQLPSLLGVAGGGHNFFERAVLLVGQIGETRWLVLLVGMIAILLLLAGERFRPGRPVGLVVVALSIVVASVFGLPALGVPRGRGRASARAGRSGSTPTFRSIRAGR